MPVTVKQIEIKFKVNEEAYESMFHHECLGSRQTGRERTRTRSSSRSRGKKRSRSKSLKRTQTRSRSRSRSRSRGRSPGRPHKSSPTATRQERVAVTPTRMSARIAAMTKEKTVEASSLEKPILESLDDDKKSIKKTTHKEFGGVIGALLMTVFLPITTYYVNLACNKEGCDIPNIPKLPVNWRSFFDVEASLIFLGWFAFQAILYMIPVGRVVSGQPIIIGNHARLPYRCNGFFAYVTSIIALGVALYFKVPVTIVYDKFLQVMTSAIVFSFLLAVFLYIKAKLAPVTKLAPGGNSGNIIYDFFMGHELNPRIGSFDFKFFCEMRPGLIGWTMLNLIFLVKDFQEDGQINPSLALIAFFQALYVADALWFEDAILTTMDIVFEGFGFMLSFGDLAWVPFLYTLQGRYVLEHPITMPWYCLAGIVVLNSIGFYIFRGSNSQKNEFRKNPHNPALAHLETIPTKKGKRLLVSGWWGLCRKPNYLGDLIMALSWSLPCGFGSVWPYFYPIYFLILLIHRERRDDAICRKKYQAAWDRYCEKVKYRIFPKIY